MAAHVMRCSRRPSSSSFLAVMVAAAFVLQGCRAAGSEEYPDAERAASEAAAPGPIVGESFADVRSRGSGEAVVLYVPSTGFAYRDGDGQLTGITVETLREFRGFVEAEYGVELEMTFVEDPDWARFYRSVRDSEGGVFGIGNVTITEGRKRELAFSPSYLTNVAVLITHEDVPELESLEAIATGFDGLTAASFTGTLHEQRLNRVRETYWSDMPVAEVHSNDELMERVGSGEGYFAWVDVYNYWRAAERLPLRRHRVGDDASEDFGVIIPLQSDWPPVMQAFFERDGGYRQTARYRELLERHLGSELAESLEAARRGEGS